MHAAAKLLIGLLVTGGVIFSLPFVIGAADVAAQKRSRVIAAKVRAMTDDELRAYTGDDYDWVEAVSIERQRRGV